MSFEYYLAGQLRLHPSIQPRDVIKLCFQAAFGPEHLLTDLTAARAYFFREFEATEPRDIPLYERISDRFCRVNLAAWKYRGLPAEDLFDMFAASAGSSEPNDADFFHYLEEADTIIARGACDFSPEDWRIAIAKYKESGIRAVHHSDRYRESEKPAYRIVDYRYIRQLP